MRVAMRSLVCKIRPLLSTWLFVASCLNVCEACFAAPVVNSGFELNDAATLRPVGWAVAGEPGKITLDTSDFHTGNQSIKLERTKLPTGIYQSLHAEGLQSKIVRLSAWLKGSD